jgi:hypothetical protein
VPDGPNDLPIPAEQLHYADPELNYQEGEIRAFITHVHYPTLGCPALLGPGQRMQVLLSLIRGTKPEEISLYLMDRHGGENTEYPLALDGAPEKLGPGPDGMRELWRFQVQTEDQPRGLFDLVMKWKTLRETQRNSVRLYKEITGQEDVLLCGDSQFHLQNQRCLERFVERVNKLDVAWIAMIGDVCDNAIVSTNNIVKLAWKAKPGEVTNHYEQEYQRSHEILQRLRHPILLMPGNHDGMTAYKDYLKGTPSDVFVGKDPENVTVYDGLHAYRQTFGPTYYSFDWGRTRYFCANSFELDRRDRLGFHGIVANWGGWMRSEQLGWLKRELSSATDKQMNKVMLIHHDPRGGSEGKQLGHYHNLREYDLNSTGAIVKSYLGYVFKNGRSGWQQEWMAPRNTPLAEHPVKDLLGALLEHEVRAVVMGHDNENWVDSYFEDDDLFKTKPTTISYPIRGDLDAEKVDEMLDLLEANDFEEISKRLEGGDEEQVEATLRAALAEVAKAEKRKHIAFSANPMKDWGLKVRRAIHFVHVDDVGAYKHGSEQDFKRYGYVKAQLKDGAPHKIRSYKMVGDDHGKLVVLEEE